MADIDANKYRKLEQLDLSFKNNSLQLNVEWFRAILQNILPNCEWHSHSCMEIHFIIKGSNTFYFKDVVMEVPAGNVILIPANYLHRLDNSTNQLYLRYVLNISIEPLNNDPEAFFISNALNITKPANTPVCSQVINLLESCVDEANERISGFLTFIQCNIMKVLLYISRELTHERKASYNITEKINYDRQRALHIVRYIEQTMSAGLVVEDIAQYMHISTKQVQRIVKSQYGLTVKQMIMQLRLKQAKSYLKDPALSVGVISSLMNFPNEQSFSRFFHNMEGQTPGQYRNGILPRYISK